MRKSTKAYVWAWALFLVVIVGCVVWPSHHELARDPYKLGAIVYLHLPDLAEYE